VVRIIEAYEMLRQRRPDLPHHLVFAGDSDWAAQPILEAAQRSPAHDYMQFLGHVGREDMAVLMSCANALILVSLCESFGIPVVEAMSCGTPVITSNNTAMPEIVGDAALLVDPYDVPAISEALERMMTDEGLQEDLRSRGFERARMFTWEKTARKTLEVLSTVADARGHK
jgi:glycosyltransferase involved in cell wall biosynthesis